MKYHSMVAIPQQGLFIYGGEGNGMTTAQKLSTLSGTWTPGPAVYLDQVDEGKCVVQVKCLSRSILSRSYPKIMSRGAVFGE